MRLYVDDIRDAPEEMVPCTTVRTGEEALALLAEFDYGVVSLDHDLGSPVMDGYKVLNVIEARAVTDEAWIPPFVLIHTANISVRGKMERVALSVNKIRTARLVNPDLFDGNS